MEARVQPMVVDHQEAELKIFSKEIKSSRLPFQEIYFCFVGNFQLYLISKWWSVLQDFPPSAKVVDEVRLTKNMFGTVSSSGRTGQNLTFPNFQISK